MSMNVRNLISEKAICEVAARHGVSTEEVREEMERAILMTWGTDRKEAMDMQDMLFPEGIPSLCDFVSAIAEEVVRYLP